jgi:hypothetical protein
VIDWMTTPWSFISVSRMTLTRNAPVTLSSVVTGDSNWTKWAGSWWTTDTFLGDPGINTYNGSDANTGLMYRWATRDALNDRLTFKIHGGHAVTFLLEGSQTIPSSGNIYTVYNAICNGTYGTVRSWVAASNSNDYAIPIDWNLRSFDSANLKAVITDAVTDGWGWTGVSNMTLSRSKSVTTSYITLGDSTWNKSAGNWFSSFTYNGEPWITTYVTGDSDTGIMWRWLTRDWKNSRLKFTVHGGHARVMVIEGGGAIPTSGDLNVILWCIAVGAYGNVIATVQGQDSNSIDIVTNLDLSKYDSANIKVVVIDNLNESWGFISASRLTVTRY